MNYQKYKYHMIYNYLHQIYTYKNTNSRTICETGSDQS